MVKSLNFNLLKKRTFTVTLPDEKQTVLLIKTPTKSLLERFGDMQSDIQEAANEIELLGELYDLCARLMSHNTANIKIEKEALEKCLDMDDIFIFIKSYAEFISDISNSKN